MKKDVIETQNWNATDYLDYFHLDKNNFSYETVIGKTLIPDAVSQRMDQTILDALTEADKVQVIEDSSADPLALFSKIKSMMDRVQRFIPATNRCVIIPASSEPQFFTNDKMMSNDYVQLVFNNISDGKIGKVLGFELIFLNDIKGGGLEYQVTSGGAKRVWTCYATSKVSIAHAIGYGANRTEDGTGGVFKMCDMPNKGGYFINAPFCCGAKVVIPEGVVRFSLETENYEEIGK